MKMKKVLIVLMLFVGLFTVTACGNKNKESSNSKSSIVGTWKNDELGYDFIYTFNKDGSGTYDANGNIMEFTYKIKGDELSILYKGDTVSFDTKYEVKGDTLNVVDSLGEDTLYKKVK